MVEIWPFFPVNLDVDEMIIHETGRIFVLKAFALHHMTPVAGGITNTDQDGFIFRPGPL
jgi:hypothetical protein